MYRPSSVTLSQHATKTPTRRTRSKAHSRLNLAVAFVVELLEQRQLLSTTVRFQSPVTTAIGTGGGQEVFAEVVADVAGDGAPDLVVASDNGTISVFPSNGDGTFGTPITVPDGLPNGGGYAQDLIVADNGQRIFVTNDAAVGQVSELANNGHGTFSLIDQAVVTRPNASIVALGYAYFNFGTTKSYNMLVSADTDGTLGLNVNLSQNAIGPLFALYSTANSATSLAIGDVTGDGNSNVFMSAGGKVYELSETPSNYGDYGAFVPLTSAGTQAAFVATADLSNNGFDDLIVANKNGTITTLLGSTNGLHTGQTLLVGPPLGNNPASLQVGDLDDSGNQSVLFIGYNATVNGTLIQPILDSSTGVLAENGPAVYTNHQNAITLADIDGDGKADLITAYYNDTTKYSDIGVRLNDTSVAPTITSADSAEFAEGVAGSFTVTTSGSPTSALSETGALPAGITFTDNGDGTATISGTATALGMTTFTITANNGLDAAVTQSFTLNVVAPTPPVFTSAATATFVAGTPGLFVVQTTGFPFPALAELGTLPTGLTFVDNGNGTASLGGTPAAGTGGSYDITITANNGDGGTVMQSFVLKVNQPPSITSASFTTFIAGAGNTFTFTSTGFPAATFTTSSTLPSGVTLVSNGDGTATLSGTPAALTGGVYRLTITASNGVGGASRQTFTLTVDEAPAFTSANNATFSVGMNSSFNVSATGYPKPTLSETGALPAGVIFAAGTGTGKAIISGTPLAGQGGAYVITISASNSVGGVVTQTFTLNVKSAPLFVGATQYSLAEGVSDSITISVKAIPTASFMESGKLPTGMVFTDNGNDTLTLAGTPPLSAAGSYPITITATNNLGSATEQITVVVTKASAVKFTTATTASFTVGTAGTFTVRATGVSSPALSLTSGTVPNGLTLTYNGDGSATLSGTPLAGSGGTYTFVFSAHNSVGTVTQTLTVTVLEATTFTSSPTSNFVVGQSGSQTIQTQGYPVGQLSEIGTLPTGLTFHNNGDGSATISGTPAAGTGGEYTLTIVSSNSSSKSTSKSKKTTTVGSGAVTQQYILDVYAPPTFTSVATAKVSVGISTPPIVVTTAGFPNAALSISGSLPGGMTFLDEGNGTGELLGIPSQGSGGTYVFVITAINNQGLTTQTFTMTVNSAVSITSSSTATFTAGNAGTFTVRATGYPIATLLSSVLPSGLTFTNNGNGTGTLTGTVATAGTYRFTFTVTNGAGSKYTQAFTLTVLA